MIHFTPERYYLTCISASPDVLFVCALCRHEFKLGKFMCPQTGFMRLMRASSMLLGRCVSLRTPLMPLTPPRLQSQVRDEPLRRLVPSAAGPNISLNGARLGACCRVGLESRSHYVSFQSADPSPGASGFGPTHPPAQPAELGSHSHGLVNATSSPGQGFTWLCTRQPFHAEFD